QFVPKLNLSLLRSKMENLFKDEVSNSWFDVPVDHGQRSEIKESMRDHDHPNRFGGSEHAAEHKSGYCSLFNTGPSLVEVMTQSKPCGCKENDGNFCGATSSK